MMLRCVERFLLSITQQGFAFLLLALSLPAAAVIYQVDGVAFNGADALENRPLVLNGATSSREFSTGLYLTERRNNVEGLLRQGGPKRIRMVAHEDIQTKTLGRVMIERIRANASDDEKARNIQQIVQVGMVFSELPQLVKGDVLTIDWLEQSGWTEFRLNGRRLGDPVLGNQFFPMFMKIWVGAKSPPAMRDAILGLGTPLPQAP